MYQELYHLHKTASMLKKIIRNSQILRVELLTSVLGNHIIDIQASEDSLEDVLAVAVKAFGKKLDDVEIKVDEAVPYKVYRFQTDDKITVNVGAVIANVEDVS